MLAPKPPTQVVQPEGPVEDLIVSGAAFGKSRILHTMFSIMMTPSGFGLFNLVFSLLPAKVKSIMFSISEHTDCLFTGDHYTEA